MSKQIVKYVWSFKRVYYELHSGFLCEQRWEPPGGAEACGCGLHALTTTYWGKGHLLFDMYPLDHSKLQNHSETKQNYCNI